MPRTDSREIDKLVHTYIFNKEAKGVASTRIYEDGRSEEVIIYHDLPKYSTNIKDAWVVIEKLRNYFTLQIVCTDSSYYVSTPVTIFPSADSVPMAICNAALLLTHNFREGKI